LKGWEGVGVAPNDEFRTPFELVRQCVRKIERYITPETTMLDPCSGTGSWVTVLDLLFTGQVEENEILTGTDFYRNHESYDWIIGNPPFSNLTRWLEHSALLAEKGIAYILPGHALSYSRLKFMESFGFYLAHLHSFDNPKEWGLGYPHFFCVWLHEKDRVIPHGMVCLGEPTQRQTRLFGAD